jgi:hypothetical protein
MDTRQLNFDVTRGGIQHRLFVRVGDANSRTIVARMYSGGEAIAFSSAQIRLLHADGTEFLGECVVDDNSATYTLTTEDIGNGGEILAEFIISISDKEYMTSPKFAITCEPLLYDGEGITGTNEYQAYITALAKIDNLSASVITAPEATVEVGMNANGGIHLSFALPKGDTGPQGPQGPQGNDGPQGPQGVPGNKGQDGYTPIRGTDYWTQEDIAEIKSYVDDAILGGAW